jgi:excinuclease UvrABC ATPase subunit
LLYEIGAFCKICTKNKRYEKVKQNSIEKYGVEHPQQYQEAKDKSKQTCIERYGVECPMKSQEVKDKIFYGTGGEEIELKIEDGLKAIRVKKTFDGIVNSMKKRIAESANEDGADEFLKYQALKKCESCNGYRLNEQSLSIKIAGLHIGQVSAMSVEKSIEWFTNLPKFLTPMQRQISERLLKEVTRRLGFL